MKSSKIIFLLLMFVTFLAINCGDNQNKNEIEQLDSVKMEDTVIVRKRDHFLFVGMYYGKPGVFKYDIEQKTYEPFFAVQKESVRSLNYSRDLNSVFFITSGKTGNRGGLPFINNIKLYRVNPENQDVELIEKIKNGSQLLAQWNEDGNFELVLTSIDNKISNYFNVDKKNYNHFGRLIDERVETYDILKDGYPSLIPNRSPTVSLSGKYGIAIASDSIFLKTAGEEKLHFIAITQYKINKVSWNDDESYLFFSTIIPNNETINKKKQSELFCFSIEEDSIIAKWKGTGEKNFITFNNFLIFDDGLNYQSFITIYDYLQNEIIETIKIRGGCGLVKIPN